MGNQEIFYFEASYPFEQARFKLGDHILQAVLTVVGQIHKYGNASGKLNQFLLYLFTLAFEFLFFFGEFLLFFGGQLIIIFFLARFLDRFGFIYDGFYILTEVSPLFSLP